MGRLFCVVGVIGGEVDNIICFFPFAVSNTLYVITIYYGNFFSKQS